MSFLLTEIIMFPYKNNFCRGTFFMADFNSNFNDIPKQIAVADLTEEQIQELMNALQTRRNAKPSMLHLKWCFQNLTTGFHNANHTFAFWNINSYTNHSHSFFRVLICNASTYTYYDSLWLVTRTQDSSWNNLLNRIFITRRRMTVYSPNAKFTQRTVSPLPSHYNKNKHSLLNYNKVI